MNVSARFRFMCMGSTCWHLHRGTLTVSVLTHDPYQLHAEVRGPGTVLRGVC